MQISSKDKIDLTLELANKVCLDNADKMALCNSWVPQNWMQIAPHLEKRSVNFPSGQYWQMFGGLVLDNVETFFSMVVNHPILNLFITSTRPWRSQVGEKRADDQKRKGTLSGVGRKQNIYMWRRIIEEEVAVDKKKNNQQKMWLDGIQQRA